MKNNKALELMERMEAIISEMKELSKEFEELISKEEIEEPVPYEEEKEEVEEDLDPFEFLSEEELEDLLEEEAKEEEKAYQDRIESPAYHIVLALRSAGLIVNHKDAEEFLETLDDPYLYTDEELLEEYQDWMIWREF